MTVREIARQAGVSAATVSRYFTGTEKVSEDVRCKIQSVLGDDVSSGKRSRHKNRLMVMIVPHMRLAFYQELMKRFMEKVSPYGIQLIFLPVFNSDAAQVRALLKRLRPDGLVILEEPVTVPILDIAYEMKIPVVVCGETLSNIRSAVIIHVNDISAAYDGTKYLLSLGHREIMFFSNHAKGVNASYQRISGCSKAMAEAGLHFDEPYIRYGELTFENGYRFAQESIKGEIPFSAIFCFSDEMAKGAICGLHDLGIKVPEDISDLGFDDLPFTEEMRPQLTTIHQPLDDFVRSTINIFFNDDFSMCGKELIMKYSIIKRDSCSTKKGGLHTNERE